MEIFQKCIIWKNLTLVSFTKFMENTEDFRYLNKFRKCK